MPPVTNWKLGPMGCQLPDGKYILTPAGQAEFDGRYAARQNPVGLVKLNWPKFYRGARLVLGADETQSAGWIGLWRAILTYPANASHALNTRAQWLTRLVMQRELYWLSDERMMRPDAHGHRKWSREKVPPWDEIEAGNTSEPDPAKLHERIDTNMTVRQVIDGLPTRDRDILRGWASGVSSNVTAAEHKTSGQYVRKRREVLLKKLAHNPELLNLVA